MASKGFLIGTVFNAPPRVFDVECITYDSSDSDYLQTPEAALGIAGIWSIGFWQRRTTVGQAANKPLWWASTSNTAGGRIAWYQATDDRCTIEVRNDAGSSSGTATWRFDNMIPANADIEWDHIVLVYNDSTVGLQAYFNGVNISDKSTSIGAGDVSITKQVNSTPDQTDLATRAFTIGSARDGLIGVGEALIYNLGVWNVELDQADVTALYNDSVGSEVDLLVDENGYDKSADLLHYWRFSNSGDRGEDLGTAPLDMLAGDSGSHTFLTNDCPDAQDDIQNCSLLYDKTFALLSTFSFDSGIDASSGSSYTFSFACWAKFTGSADAGRNALIAVRENAAASALDWGLDDNSNTDLTCILVNAAQSVRQFQTWSDVITPGAWHHIVLTWDGTVGTGSDADGPHCYVDGVNVDSGNRAALLQGDGSGFTASSIKRVSVGTQIGGGTNWEGPMFSASIYNNVLAPAEVAELYASGNAQTVDPRVNTGDYVSAGTLLHYYRLGVGQSDVQFGQDETLNGNEIPMSELGVIDYPDDLTGDIPAPTSFVETTSYVSSDTDYFNSAPALVGIGAEWTIALWLKRTAVGAGTDRRIFGISDGGGVTNKIGFSHSAFTDRLVIFFTDATGLQLQSKTWQVVDLPVSGLWEHFTFAYNSNGGSDDTFALYWNGNELTTGIKSGVGDPYLQKNADSVTVNQGDSSRNIAIGAGADGASGIWGNGKVYNWACWDAEFSAAAAAELYNSGNAAELNLELDGTNYMASNLVHLYRFDDSSDRGKDRGNGAEMDLDGAASGSHAFDGDFPGDNC